jgi:hypothetical protein
VRALGVPAITPAPAPSATATILASTTQAAINKYASTASTGGGLGSAGKAAGTAAAGAGIQAVAAAAMAIPVYGWAVAGAIEIAGAIGMGGKGLGSGCSPDEPQLPGASGLPGVTAAQAGAYFAANPDVEAYFKKCGAIWSATPQLYVAWHWANFGGGKDGKTRTSPYDYPAGDTAVSPAALGVPAGAATVPASTPGLDPTTLLLLSQFQSQAQRDAAAATQLQYQQQLDRQAAVDKAAADYQAMQLKIATDAQNAQLAAAAAAAQAQAQVTAASLSAQAQVIEAQKISDAQAASAAATAAAAQSTSQVEVLRIAAQAAQSRTMSATAAATAAAKLAADTVSGSQTRKYLLIAAVVVTAGFVAYEVVRRRRGRSRSGAGSRALALA